jgi:glycosyltransferase involved in cell wall biosynthesis
MTLQVSILVPIYNVSDYIERCAHSLFQQTFDDIEYIFVNDCTPDDSIEKLQKVIEQYPNRKPFVKIINHEKNKGSSASRNTAIDNSTGQYIQYIDSDDWIEPDMVEVMYKKAEAEAADIVICDILVERKNRKDYYNDYIPKNNQDYFRCMLEQKCCLGYLVLKLVRRELFELSGSCFVETLNILEDRFALTMLYYYAKKIVKIDKAFYHYDKTNANSLTSYKTSMHYENIILFHTLLGNFLKEKGLYEKYKQVVEQSKVGLKSELFYKTKDYKLRRKYANIYRDIEMKYIKNLTFKGEKIIIFLNHYRLYFLAHLAVRLIQWKNRNDK